VSNLSPAAQAVHCPVCGVTALPKKYEPFFTPDPVYRVAMTIIGADACAKPPQTPSPPNWRGSHDKHYS
jgi:hypothetical protein